jgi:bacterioferritin-associated ferredoxin
MTAPKTMVCRCEDISLEDCQHAIREGYRCLEDLKRFLGVATGPCQGKSCVALSMQLVAEATGLPVEEVDVMTFRPPVRPIAFATLAAPDAGDVPAASDARTTARHAKERP